MAGKIYVCETCIEDAGLQEVVRKNAISNRCDYCEREETSPIACELSDVLERIRFAIDQEYNDPAGELPWDRREGGYQGTVFDGAYELFDSIGFSLENEELFDDICDNFMEPFCDRDYYGPTPKETFKSGWDRFKQVVQHQRRYTFWNSLEEGDYGDPAYGISASNIMQVIAHDIERISPVLVLPVGTEMWRVQVFNRGSSPTDPARYTSPPLEKATQPNRMSPGGIPMLYTAEDFDTGYVETVEPDKMEGKEATGAKFVTLVPLNVLDLSSIRRPRSFFVDLDRRSRHAIDFLEAFAEDLSRPIQRDERQHIEYVPTQVFTEYVRFEMQTPEGEPFHGLKYTSSRNGRACYVLFAEQSDCLPGQTDRPRPQVVQFIEVAAALLDNRPDLVEAQAAPIAAECRTEWVAANAYFRWLNEGRPHNRHLDHWMDAEREFICTILFRGNRLDSFRETDRNTTGSTPSCPPGSPG